MFLDRSHPRPGAQQSGQPTPQKPLKSVVGRSAEDPRQAPKCPKKPMEKCLPRRTFPPAGRRIASVGQIAPIALQWRCGPRVRNSMSRQNSLGAVGPLERPPLPKNPSAMAWCKDGRPSSSSLPSNARPSTSRRPISEGCTVGQIAPRKARPIRFGSGSVVECRIRNCLEQVVCCQRVANAWAEHRSISQSVGPPPVIRRAVSSWVHSNWAGSTKRRGRQGRPHEAAPWSDEGPFGLTAVFGEPSPRRSPGGGPEASAPGGSASGPQRSSGPRSSPDPN